MQSTNSAVSIRKKIPIRWGRKKVSRSMAYDPDLQLPSTARGPVGVTGLHGGFIPVNPLGVTALPGERSPIPPTSPLLTPPPGSAAMPYVWRP